MPPSASFRPLHRHLPMHPRVSTPLAWHPVRSLAPVAVLLLGLASSQERDHFWALTER